MTRNVKKSMQKVYLAGKCDPDNDWRGYFSADCGPIYSVKDGFWIDHHFEYRAGFICTGPFPTNAKGGS